MGILLLEVDYYPEAIRLILDGIDRKSSVASGTVPDSTLMTETWPWKIRADVQGAYTTGNRRVAILNRRVVNSQTRAEFTQDR